MKEKEMVEETEGNRMMDVSEMLNLAKALYTSQVIENLWHEHYSKIWRRQIERELKRLGIKNDSEKEKIKLDSRLVDVIIQDIMYEYFLGYVYNDEENGCNYKDAAMQRHKRYKEEIQKRKEERLKELQEKSAQCDEERNKRNEEMAEEYYSELIERQELQVQSGNPYSDEEEKFCYRRVTSEEERQKEERRGNVVLSNDAVIPGDILRYSLPTISLDDMREEHVQKIVDRMMLRAVFGLFFDFKEQEFCTDLFERASRIDGEDDVIKYQTGYDALTRELENPKHYIKKKPRR